MPIQSLGSARYMLDFKDDATGFRTVFFIKHKSDVYECFKEFERAVYVHFRRTMKSLRSDGGGEFCNARMDKYLKDKGIVHDVTSSDTQQQKGAAERENRTNLSVLVRC